MKHDRARIITAVPLILVNVVAVSGQYVFLREHLPWPWYGAVIFAAALESVALYLAYMAHMALISLDSSMRLRLGAIGFGLLAGILNYSHYSADGKPTFVAIATGIMSASSPWLWAVYSHRVSRDRLMQLGLIEPGAVRLGAVRWLMYPVRSFRVFRNAAWDGIREPGHAIAAWDNRPELAEPKPEHVSVAVTAPEPEPERERDSLAQLSQAQAIMQALTVLGHDASGPEVVRWLAGRGVTVTAGYVRQRKSRSAQREIETRRDSMRTITARSANE
jgi:hypothetical protein